MPVSILNGISTCLRREILYERRKKNIFQVTAAQLVLKIKAERRSEVITSKQIRKHYGIEEYFILLLICILILVNTAPVIMSVKQKLVL